MLRKIQVLDKSVADKIAAGEVVDRPVSIVKELVENAIDSGANSITVEIRGGGKEYIRITDNGCGIEADDVEIAFLRHATSKITSAHDLDAIMTLGFRGEALASIGAVARVEVITKTQDARMGRHVIVDGSRILSNEPIGCPDGTTITVKDLFFNVPARLKFLGSDGAESRRIIDLMSRVALAYPDIRIKLVSNNKPVFNTSGKGNILDNIVSIYGADIGKDLIPVSDDREGNHIRGFVSNPGLSMSTRTRQIFCVNGRVVSSGILEKAVDRAYKERLFQGRFPVAFLFLAVPANKLDVNIHPTKKEVRFDDSAEIEDFVAEAITKALQAQEAVPEVRSDDVKEVPREQFEDPSHKIDEKPKLHKKPEQGEQIDVKNLLSTMRDKADSLVKMSKENVPLHQMVKEDIAKYRPTKENAESDVADTHESKDTAPDSEIAASFAMPAIQAPLKKPFDIDDLTILGSLFNTYILASAGDVFYMIDQHAAHERVFYEKLRGQYEASEKFSQQLMIPLNFNVSADVATTEEKWMPAVKSMGYDVEFFGNNTYLVREIPAFMELKEAEDFLNDLFNQFSEKPDMNNPAIIDKIIMRSCKSAIKGGDVLSNEEIKALLDQLKQCINPFSCPHGRPTFIRMSRYEIERMFKRA